MKQKRIIAIMASRQLKNFLETGNIVNSVNFQTVFFHYDQI